LKQRLSLVTLGVADLGRSVGFYGALGWTPANDWEQQGVAFYESGGMVVALWSRDELADDSEVEDTGGWGGVTFAHNVGSREEVDAVLAEARAAGATIARPGGEAFWGGYTGIFIDPDGHPWEVAHNPHWTVEDDGSVRI
jgi:predicted lactoylglutathione lyase